jgi:hypothetical protein
VAIADVTSWSSVATWVSASPHRLVAGSRPVIADLDGTLSDPGHRRHHLSSRTPDWVSFSMAAAEDPPLLREIQWLNAHGRTRPVVIISGRPSIAITLTQSWLQAHRVRWDAIALRPPGDRVRGTVHKIRVLAALRRFNLEPEFAFDDSQEAREAYQAEGVTCRLPSGGRLPEARRGSSPARRP